MSQERTEKPTQKRRDDARKRGQIPRGADVTASVVFLAGVIAVKVLGGDMLLRFANMIRGSSERIAHLSEMGHADASMEFLKAGTTFGLVVMPILAIVLVASIIGNASQGGIVFSGEALKPKLDRFNPANNIKRVFGSDSAINLIKTSLKLVVLGYIAWGVLQPVIFKSGTFIGLPSASFTFVLGDLLYQLAMRCGAALLVLACADYAWNWWKHEKSLRMSKQEIRDEYKDQEGDPMVKGQRMRAARALVQKRSIANASTATVVITNPTHFAVALRYDREKDAAPVVVSKGADNLARKIREIAKENGIPLYENPPLARALFKLVEPDQTIPIEFFGAVAEILAYVMRSDAETAVRH